jgi:hypothetical protein
MEWVELVLDHTVYLFFMLNLKQTFRGWLSQNSFMCTHNAFLFIKQIKIDAQGLFAHEHAPLCIELVGT